MLFERFFPRIDDIAIFHVQLSWRLRLTQLVAVKLQAQSVLFKSLMQAVCPHQFLQ
jgi:hypothetical protein